MKIIYVLFLLIGILFSGDVYYDKKSGLTWQDNKEVVEKVYELESGIFNTGAIEYCTKLELNGFDDWRLPTLREYINILDISKNNPAIRVDFKYVVLKENNNTREYYWTSTLLNKMQKNTKFKYVYMIELVDGSFYHSNYEEKAHFVRCVRNGIN